MDPEPEMGAAAAEAAAYDTSPPPLHQNPPILLGQSAIDLILRAMEDNTNKMEANVNGMKQEMKEEIKKQHKQNGSKLKRSERGNEKDAG